MPKSKVQQVTNNIRSLLEHKNAFEVNSKMSEYINPGPVENIVILPTRNGKGAINMASLGGDYDPKQLTDLNWFNNKLFGGLKIPKQFLCLRGNVEIPLLDGETLSIEEMYKNKEKYIGKGILSCNEDGSIVPTIITNILLTRKDASFVRVYLDNGETFDVTPDHKVMMRDGSFKEAKDLIENDSLMPYYSKIKNGRLEVLDNKEGRYKKQYRLVSEYYYDVPKGSQVHHIDEDKRNDDISNLEVLSLEEHYQKHKDELHRKNRESYKTKKEIGKLPYQTGWTIINNGIEEK